MSLLVSSAVVLVWMVSLAWGQMFDKPAFDTGYAARRYLWYFSIMNTFDTCLVEYIMGEVALRSPSRSQLVYLRVRQDERRGQCIHGRDEQGIDSVLQARCTSYPFVIPDSARISFFRVLQGAVLCGKGRGEPRLPLDSVLQPVPHNTVEKSWTLYPYCIHDRSEFVIQLVRAEDDSVLLTLDSIGVEPNPDHPVPRRYGTAPDTRTRDVALPEAVWNLTAYLRVSPRRYGDTPYGMELRKNSSGILLSLLYPNSDTLARVRRAIEPLMTGQKDTLYAARTAAIFDYVEREGSQTGCITYLPIPYGESIEEDEYLYDSLTSFIMRRGYICADCLGMHQNDPTFEQCFDRWREHMNWYDATFDDTATHSPMIHPASLLATDDRSLQPRYPTLALVSPMYVHHPLTIISPVMISNAHLKIYDMAGRLVYEHIGTVAKGITTVPLNLSRGYYTVEVHGGEGALRFTGSLIIQ